MSTAGADLNAIRERWIEFRPIYKRFAEHIEERLKAECLGRGIACKTESRAKGIAKLVKKAMKDGLSYEEIGDKAGVRVVATYPDDVPSIDAMIQELFEGPGGRTDPIRDDKAARLEPDQFQYSGLHFQTVLSGADLVGGRKLFEGLECEIQVHTRAQNLWSDSAHDLSYKPPETPPPEVERAINRLVALVEIFDKEITSVRSEIKTMEGYEEANLLECVEQQYYQFSTEEFDRDLSLQILGSVKKVLGVSAEELAPRLEGFVTENAVKIRGIYAQYREDERANLLLSQPEVILLFYQLEQDPFVLAEVWPLPFDILENLGSVWGVEIPSPS